MTRWLYWQIRHHEVLAFGTVVRAFLDTFERNLVPRALSPGFGSGAHPTSKAKEKHPGDEVGLSDGRQPEEAF